jgi:hypothetical protein
MIKKKNEKCIGGAGELNALTIFNHGNHKNHSSDKSEQTKENELTPYNESI